MEEDYIINSLNSQTGMWSVLDTYGVQITQITHVPNHWHMITNIRNYKM